MFIRPPRWLVKPAADGAAELAAETGLPPLLTHLLAQRGITTAEKARDFLVPKLATLGDPRLLPEMPAAVDRILKAVDEKQRVVLYGVAHGGGLWFEQRWTREVLRALRQARPAHRIGLRHHLFK
jgi:hypothetical protein